MTKFRIALESSAAVCVGIELEAEDCDQAEELGAAFIEKHHRELADLVAELVCVNEHALKAYAESVGLPFTYATVELDENGFEPVDAFTPDPEFEDEED
jgi:hypothetical protein